MPQSSTSRFLLSAIHASATVSVYILFREFEALLRPLDRNREWSTLDPIFCAGIGVLILVIWLLRRRGTNSASEGMWVGLRGAAAFAVLAYVSVLALAARSFLLLYFLFHITVFAILIAISAVVGGVIIGAIFRFTNTKRAPGYALVSLVAALSMIVPVGAAFARHELGMGFLDMLVRYDQLRPFPLKISIDLTVRGLPLHIERVLLCSRVVNKKDRKHVRANRVRGAFWMPGIKSFGHAFLDKSGVFVVTPDVCNASAKKPEFRGNILGQDYVPLIGWTPDVSTLERIDLLVDGSAFNRPDAAVKFEGISMQRMPFGTPVSQPDDFAKIGWQDRSNPKDISAVYRAVFGTAFRQERWSKVPEVASILSILHERSFVLGELSKLQERAIRRLLGVDRDYLYESWVGMDGSGISKTPRSINAKNAAPVFPLHRESGRWVAKPDQLGVLTFYKMPGNRFDSSLPESLMVYDRMIVGRGERYYFDPASNTLVYLFFAYRNLPATDSPYASH